MHKSPVAKSHDVTASLSWTGIAAWNLVSFFTIFGPTKLISSSKSAGTIQVNFLYNPQNYWHFKLANKLVPLYTDLFLCNSVCHQCPSHHFLLLYNMWCTNITAALATCKDDIFPPEAANAGGSQRVACSPECVLSCPNLDLKASRTPHNYVTLLRCSRMLKSVCDLKLWKQTSKTDDANRIHVLYLHWGGLK